MEILVYVLPWYHVCTKAMFISEGSYGYGECKNVFLSSVQKPHFLCETANDPVSCKPVQGRERKFMKIRVYLLPWYHVCTKAMFILKKKLRVWREQKCISLVGAKTSRTCTGLQTTPCHVSQYRAENGNLRIPVSTFCHGTVFVPKQCLYQKEATGMESSKMYASRRCKKVTYQCGTANDLVSSNPV